MPAFLTNLPTWVLVLAGIIIAYIAYRWWMYRKSVSYTPNVIRGQDVTLSSLRDNPTNGG